MQYNSGSELQKWMAYCNYGQYTNFVVQQAQFLMQSFPSFKPVAEQLQIPGEQFAANLLVFKGTISAPTPTGNEPFKIKMALPTNFPFRPPKCYIDQNLHTEVVRSKNYIGQQNEITIPYLAGWNISNQPNLKDLVKFLESIIKSDPPILTSSQRNSMFVPNETGGPNPQDVVQQPN